MNSCIFAFQYKGDYLYLLKWKGYSDADNTWEPADNLYCCDLLTAYREKFNLSKKKEPSKLKLKSKLRRTRAVEQERSALHSEQNITNECDFSESSTPSNLNEFQPSTHALNPSTLDLVSRVAKNPEPEQMELMVCIKLNSLCPCGVLHRISNGSKQEALVHSLWCVSHDHTYFLSTTQAGNIDSSSRTPNSVTSAALPDNSDLSITNKSTEVCDLKLYLSPSPTPSGSDLDPVHQEGNSDNEELFQPLCSHTTTTSVQTAEVNSRWKGPMPLPRTFSKKHSCQTKLRTKAAKVNHKCKDCKNVNKKSGNKNEHSHAPLQREAKLKASANPVWKTRSDTLTTLKKEDEKPLSLFRKKTTKPSLAQVSAKCSTTKNGSVKNTVSPVQVKDTVSLAQTTNPALPIIQISHCENLRFKADYAYQEILMNWQYELNKQRGGTDNIILVENEVDRVLPPAYFKYTSSNIYRKGVPDPASPEMTNSLCGCECYYLGRKCGPKSEFCCAHMAGSKFAYSPRGKVCVEPGTPIYECNLKCSCRLDCPNRIVQLGRQFPLCIFRTHDRGWGVKATQPIKSNSFVSEYVGEVITNEEAEKRGQKCDAQGITYLFDLDFEDDNSAFTVDAANYGNISHFFNHSVS